jgi:hypothetical protein
MIETTSIITNWYIANQNSVNIENLFGQSYVFVDAFIHRLLVNSIKVQGIPFLTAQA